MAQVLEILSKECGKHVIPAGVNLEKKKLGEFVTGEVLFHSASDRLKAIDILVNRISPIPVAEGQSQIWVTTTPYVTEKITSPAKPGPAKMKYNLPPPVLSKPAPFKPPGSPVKKVKGTNVADQMDG